MAADVIDLMIRPPQKSGETRPPGNGLAIAAISGFLILICIGLAVFTGNVPVPFIWGAITVTLATVLVLIRRGGRVSVQSWSIAILLLICLDLGGVDYLNLGFQPASEVLSQGYDAASRTVQMQTAEGGEAFRIYSPSYSLPQQTAANLDLQLADGIDPLQLTAYAKFMQGATGVADTTYSVTLPPFKTGSPETDNQGSLPDSHLLGLLNVKYVLSAFRLNADGLSFVDKIGDTFLFQNMKLRPRAWTQGDLDPSNPVFSTAGHIQWSPNEIDIYASGEGWLVLSEIDYPGWTAAVDGKPVNIVPFDGLLRAVKLDAGDHLVTFEFKPASVYAGVGLAILGWLAVGVFVFVRSRKKW